MKKENGITLVALVISIIVIIILAGVTINTLINNGIIDKAKTATQEYKNAQDYEETQIAKYTNQLNSYVEGNRDAITISEEDYNKLERKGTWVLLASSTSSTEETKEVSILSQFSSVVLVNYSSATTIINTSIISYDLFKTVDSLDVRWTRSSDGNAIDVAAQYVDDTHVKLCVTRATKVELYGIY